MTDHKKLIHERTFDIVWGDMDALGHVNNARYFDYFQEARVEWLSSIGLGLRDATGPVVVNISCTYLKPVIYPARLRLCSQLHSLGRSSMVLDHDLYQDECLMAQGVCKIVWIDYRTNTSIPFPDKIRERYS